MGKVTRISSEMEKMIANLQKEIGEATGRQISTEQCSKILACSRPIIINIDGKRKKKIRIDNGML